MGGIAWRTGERIYLDTNLFIYAVEAINPYAEHVGHLFQAADRGDIKLVTSLLTLAEALVMPFRRGDDLLINAYRELFLHPPAGLLVAQLDADILERAARLRASSSSLRLPDAIHLATAESEQCNLFATNDRRFCSSSALRVVVFANEGGCLAGQ